MVGGRVSGDRVVFVGEAMASIVQGIAEIRSVIGQPPVVVGGLAVLCRLSNPYRATTDLDVVDRRRGGTPHLQVLRAVSGAEPVEPAAVLLPTAFGLVKVDVLEVRQVEIDHPSDDPGDRLRASAHAWAHDTATDLRIGAVSAQDDSIEVTTPVAEPGPLIAMKLQAVMNRSSQKQATTCSTSSGLPSTLGQETLRWGRSERFTMPSLVTSDYMSNCGSAGDGRRLSHGSAAPAPRASSSMTSTWSPSYSAMRAAVADATSGR